MHVEEGIHSSKKKGPQVISNLRNRILSASGQRALDMYVEEL